MERLFAQGALDVFLTPIQMKKNRPATLLTVITPTEKSEDVINLIFQETTTFGIRQTEWKRQILERSWVTIETEFGNIRIKIGKRDGKEITASPEYEDVKAAALQYNIAVKKVYLIAQKKYQEYTLNRE